MNVGFNRNVLLWAWIVVGVVAILAMVQLYLVNHPAAEPIGGMTVKYSDGEIVNGELNIKPGKSLNFPINLNRRRTLKGKFFVSNNKAAVACIVVDSKNYEQWKTGADFKAIASTGYLPGGEVKRMLEPGSFFLIFDNRNSIDKTVVLTASFVIE